MQQAALPAYLQRFLVCRFEPLPSPYHRLMEVHDAPSLWVREPLAARAAALRAVELGLELIARQKKAHRRHQIAALAAGAQALKVRSLLMSLLSLALRV